MYASIVKLIKNWRSHNAILKFPNEEFYKSELEACGDPAITESLLRWDGLVQRGFPVIFHGVSGKDEREASSPSFFNIAEASLVKTYVQDLFEDRRLRLSMSPILFFTLGIFDQQQLSIRTYWDHLAVPRASWQDS